MGSIKESVEIAAPLQTVYDAFARFEDLPEFVHGVQHVRVADDTHLRLRFGDAPRDVGAEITEQRPFERIAWHAPVSGSVTFESLGDGRTLVTVRLDDGNTTIGGDGRVRGDLDRFKAVAEARSRAG